MRNTPRRSGPQPRVIAHSPMPGGTNQGLAGDMGGIRSFGQLVGMLRAHFQPVNTGTPPLSRGTGSRIAQTKQSTPNAPTASDATVVQLVAGVAQWTFATSFAQPPLVQATPIGQPPSSGTTIYVGDQTTTVGALIRSTDGTDTRQVYLHASGIPG